MSKHDNQMRPIDDDWAEQVSNNPGWDQDMADELVGAIVLVDITEVDGNNEAVEEYQMWGMVENVDADAGIEIELHGELAGESWICPPDLDAFEIARPGVYTLEQTGETVTDPDFTTSWTFSRNEDDVGDADDEVA